MELCGILLSLGYVPYLFSQGKNDHWLIFMKQILKGGILSASLKIELATFKSFKSWLKQTQSRIPWSLKYFLLWFDIDIIKFSTAKVFKYSNYILKNTIVSSALL